MHLKDKPGNQWAPVWKSRVAKKVIGSTLAAEEASVVEAIEWAEYIKFLRKEIVERWESMDIVVYTD